MIFFKKSHNGLLRQGHKIKTHERLNIFILLVVKSVNYLFYG